MARPLTSEQHEQIRALKGLPQRTIAARVGCSLGAVSKALRAPEAVTGGAASELTKPAAPEGLADVDDALAAAEALVSGDTSDDAAYARCLARLEVASKLAASDRDVARMVSCERSVALVVQARAKARPAPVADANEMPDMVEAARRFRERAHAVLDRILAGVAK